jgi:sulfopropanediol 3-dehydrogenase
MAVNKLKSASKQPQGNEAAAREVAAEMLANIKSGGEAAVRDYARRLDKWEGDILVSAAEIERRTASIPAGIKRDIEFAAG